MSREAEFLLSAVRRFVDRQAPLPEPASLDWSAVLRLARAHAVTPILHRTLSEAALPDEVARRLRASFEEDVRWSLTLGAELVRLADSFDARGIAAVPIKGPLLSQRLHGDPSIRTSSDLDFLIHPGDILRARDALRAEGYELASALHWPCDSAYLRCRDAELSFLNRARNMSVDLHWRAVPAYYPSPFDTVDIWQSLIKTRFARRDLSDLSVNNLLLFLCAHGAKHAFERLGWICDIACCARMPDVNWPGVFATSAQAGTTRQLVAGLRVAADLLGASLRPQLPDDPRVEPLVRQVRDRLLTEAPLPIPISGLVRFWVQVLESDRHRLRFFAGHFLLPSRAEYEAVKLPPALYSLYYPLRPLRLVAKLGFQSRSSTVQPNRTV